ncbi:hypothetical protein [Alteribacter aurantiacus]|uniref:YfjL-like protein n=1 Tax=Alteribacter aurantiacus TaxID=254410 RepID=UPI00040CF01D|nr:hypothetical protein [Alteribacter aurantiacus]
MLRRLLIFFSILVPLSIVFGYFYLNGAPWTHTAAKDHAKSFIAFEYSVDKEDLETVSSQYSRSQDRYAVKVKHKEDQSTYEVAIRMEGQREAGLTFDVTGQYDSFGTAYCH